MIFRLLSAKFHGVLDVIFVGFFLAGPALFGFSKLSSPTWLCVLLGALQAAMIVFTAYPLGVFRRIRFITHGSWELITGFFLLGAPSLLNLQMSSKEKMKARLFLILLGVAELFVAALTNYDKGLAPGGHRLKKDL